MRCNVVLAGVGGQGVLSLAAILAEAARRDGFVVKQGEVHGMSQRGGAVQAGLQMARGPIESDLIPRGRADLILGLEPVESLRHLDYLAPGGKLVTSGDPLRNIVDYPHLDRVRAMLRMVPGSVILDAVALAGEAGNPRAVNMVMAGAAASVLPIAEDTIEACVRDGFAAKGGRIVEANVRAFRAGRAAVAAATP